MTVTQVAVYGGVPTLFLDGAPEPPIAAYVGPGHVATFLEAGVRLFTFSVPGIWWVGPGQYDFDTVDAFLANYVARIPGGYFMPRIYLGTQGFPWWGRAHPEEMNVVRSIATGERLDQTAPNPEAVHYLGHEVRLETLNLHSFHSQVWRRDAAEAVAALVAHCEAAPYARRLWGWHLADGLFAEWFHWSEYAFGGLADYSVAAQADFRRWLRATYADDPQALARAWGRAITFEEATIPEPQARDRPAHGEFYDPVRDRPAIDYTQCLSDAAVDSIIAVCEAAKHALPRPKVVGVFYGYQFSDMPRPQLNGHYALARILASPVVDLLASPHAYSNRGEGGYHSPQAVADAIRRAGKLHFDEIDCKTVWTPASVTWKRHISQPQTVASTVQLLKKDAAYQLASGTAQWWMDLTDQGWFDAPEAVAPLQKLREIEVHLQERGRRWFGDIALVVSQRATHFQAPREGLHNATQLVFRNWHLARMGAPFEQLLVDDLARPDLPAYKLYIMANAFYLSEAERRLVHRVVKRDGATALWIYAPGYLNDEGASLAAMASLTGIRIGCIDKVSELNVTLTDFDHPLTRGLSPVYTYGTGVALDQYLQPPRIEYLPRMAVRPVFFAEDPDARGLGVLEGSSRAGLVVKDLEGFSSVYSAAPLLPWDLLRNLARYAGVHIYDDAGDMLWANDVFLAVYAQHAGERTLRFPGPVTVTDAFTGEILGAEVTALVLDMARWETRLLLLT